MRDLDDDIREHIARETEENIARGMTPGEARRQAQVTFGSVALAREDTARVWAWAWLEPLLRDVRLAGRTLRRNRTFAATAAATLALAIGANTLMFSVLHAVVLRPLPYRSPEQLAMLWTENPAQNLREGRSSRATVAAWRQQTRTFSELAVFDSIGVMLTAGGGTERILGIAASPNLFALLGVEVALGRGFSLTNADGAGEGVLISHDFWQERFGGARDVVGATLVLDGSPRPIAGVLPERFQVAGNVADVWVPLADPSYAGPGPETWFVIGRLQPGVTAEQAQAEMNTIARRVNETIPEARRRGISVVPLSLQVVGAQARLGLWMLGGAVFGVLLIAAANVTSLSLARSVARTREMALRAALGASAGQLLRQVLVEGVVLAAIAGVVGTLLASAGIRLIGVFGPNNLARLDEVTLDPRVMAWTAAISLLTGLGVALAPALMATRRDLRSSGGGDARGASGSATAHRIRRLLVVAEFALALVLLVGAGLLVRSWLNVTRIDAGFRPERVLMVELTSPSNFTPAQRAVVYERILERINAVPGVERAGMIGDMFISNSRERLVSTEGALASEQLVRLAADEASADLFSVLNTPLRQGRLFSAGDTPDTPRVAVINESLARQLWPGRDPLGNRLKIGARDSDSPWLTVVGVVGDMRRQGPERAPIPQMFVALTQSPSGSVDIFIRTSRDNPLELAGAIRAAVHSVDGQVPVFGVVSLENQVGGYLTQRRFETSLLTGFAAMALLMAAVGIYGLLQYAVSARTREIGLRMAIGARPGDVFRMLIREGVQLSAIGLVIGLAGAFLVGRIGSRLLYGVTPWDPWTFAGVALVLTAVATAACYFPARRAMRIQVTDALRQA
jgi:predicted permease